MSQIQTSVSGSLRVPKFPVRKWNKEEGEGTYRSEITHQEPAGEGHVRGFWSMKRIGLLIYVRNY